MNTKDVPTDVVDVQSASPSRRLFVRNVALSALGLLAGCGCRREETREMVGKALPNETEKAGSNEDGFDFHEFSPVADGVIVHSDFKSDSAKTLILFSDFHPESSDDPSVLKDFERCQRFIFDNVATLVEKHGSVDLVQENSATDTVTRKDLLGVRSGWMAEMGDLARVSGEERRIDSARRIVGSDLSKIVSICLIAVYDSDRLNFVPVYTPRELDLVMRRHSNLTSFAAMSANPEIVSCPGGGINFHQARTRFESGDLSPEVIDCFCTLHHVETDLIDDFGHSRWIDAPRKEVYAASRADGKFAVVVAGDSHFPEAISYADEKGLNCVVVAPREKAEDVSTVIRGSFGIGHTLARDPNGVCDESRAEYERWKKAASVR